MAAKGFSQEQSIKAMPQRFTTDTGGRPGRS